MLTWRLWRALRYPPVSPLLRMKATRLPQSPLWPLPHFLAWRGVMPKLLLLIAALALMQRFGVAGLLLGAFAVPGAIVLIFLGLPLLLPLASLFLGSYWAADISRNIRRERVTRTWDLVCAAPTGTPGASHAIASRCLMRSGVFSTVQMLQLIALGLCLAGLLLMGSIFVVMLLRGAPADELIPALRTLIDIIALVAALWLHWQQTVVLAALTGLLLASSDGQQTPLFATLLFPALQLGSWTLFALQLNLLQPLTAQFDPQAWLIQALLPLAYLALFLLPREGLVHALWHLVGQRLQTDELFNSPLRQNATARTG